MDIETGGRGCVLAVRGELDIDSCVQVYEAMDVVLAATPLPQIVVVDCSTLRFCDSSGLNALLRMHRRLASHGSVLRMAAVPGSVRRVFTLTGLDQVIGLYGTVADASTFGAGEDGPSSASATSER
ncbi:STAS domain-containing protein [Kitasatospora sp. NPDC101157]|uniref:STAS domain-containing protein n=1 Tax=Kitasatospora sp. NPDC101157 TaxID=3364098 RepID=UPI00380F8F3A